MNDTLENQEFQTPSKRPGFLTVLCILTFVYTGLSLISSMFSLVSGPRSEDEMLQSKVEMTSSMNEMYDLGAAWAGDIFRDLIHMLDSFNQHHTMMTISSILIVAIGLFGAILMFKGRKLGFHLYIIYSLLLVVQVYFFVDPKYVPMFFVITNLVLAGLFIFLYSRNLKWLK